MLRLLPLSLLFAVACESSTDTGSSDTGDSGPVGLDTADTADTADTGDTAETGLTDLDHDGYAVEGGDCDDTNPDVHPGAEEVWYDSIDQDCDGNDGDKDGDGIAKSGFGGTDCNDDDASIYPGATEVCDGIDQDCDGILDEEAASYWFRDADGDGYGDAEVASAGCGGAVGYVNNDDDCDDEAADVNPLAEDVCDGKDNNCDGETDEGSVTAAWYLDADGDGYGDSTEFIASCYQPAGYVESWFDCDDADPAVNPGAAEVCDGIDNDCDKSIDPDDSVDAGTWYTDADGDTYGDPATAVTTCTQPADTIATGGDCDDTAAGSNPGATESCDGVDDDCDGEIDEAGSVGEITWYDDLDADGYGDAGTGIVACEGTADQVADATDCDDSDAAVNPGATEVCNGYDDDCDSAADEALLLTVYADVDLDGYGDASTMTEACSTSSGWVTDGTDCDDVAAAVNPGATETCNDVDDDCDAAIDEAGAVGEADWYTDLDGDGFGTSASHVVQCDAPTDGVNDGGDCDDGNVDSFPGAPELCDGEDNDCDGSNDDDGLATWWSPSGAPTDVTAELSAGTASSPVIVGDATTADLVISDGTLELCDGTWYAQVNLARSTSDVVVRSLSGASTTTMTVNSTGGGFTGPVVYVTNATLEVEGLTLTDGNGYSARAGGGVVANRSGSLPSVPTITLTDSIVTGNSTMYGGGLAVYGYSWIDLVDTVVTDNTGTVAGGGFWIQNHGELSCTASALGAAGFTDNTAPYGGAGYLSTSTDGTVDSVGCDWGSDSAGDDNATYDIQQAPASTDHYCYANATSLTDTVACAAGTCTASNDTPCP